VSRPDFEILRSEGGMWHAEGGTKPKGERPLGRPRLNDRIILKWVLKMLDGRAWTGLMWRRVETSDGVL